MIATYASVSSTWTSTTATTGDSTGSDLDWDDYQWSYTGTPEEITDFVLPVIKKSFWCNVLRERIKETVKKMIVVRELFFRRLMFSKSGWLPRYCPKRG